MGILDQAIDSTGGRLVHSEHNPGRIAVDIPDFDKQTQQQIDRITSGPWDAAEYGISREVAIQRIRDADTPEKRAEVLRDLRTRALRRAELDTSTGRVAVVVAATDGFTLPWHQLGNVWSDYLTPQQAIELGGLDYTVSKRELWARPTSLDDTRRTGRGWELLEGRYGLGRDDTGEVFPGVVVSGRYTILQNRDAAAIITAAVGDNERCIESAGALGHGERIWLQAKLSDPVEVANGDTLALSMMIYNPHDGSGCAEILPTSERAVCANTVRIARLRAEYVERIRHTNSLRGRVEQAKQQIAEARDRFTRHCERASFLARKQLGAELCAAFWSDSLDRALDVTANQMQQGAAALADEECRIHRVAGDDLQRARELAERKWTHRITNRKETELDLWDRYESDRNNGLPSIAGSAWAAFTTLGEAVDHSPYFNRSRGSDRAKEERRFDSILTGRGHDIKQEALARVVELVAR